MESAKLLITRNNQAVRLPNENHFSESEEGTQGTYTSTILFPIEKAWGTFLEGLESFTDDFLPNGREQ
ncbi:MAG: AbrB/MazE/SpoVT family DNA-binding domain-containing protein [Dehalococcoidia bacterium]|nr:AbrB/MazE/SpoVT family DNA-binding domain-containing protein [Dehalococcoidia bacterium]